jgi:hypothetical protein
VIGRTPGRRWSTGSALAVETPVSRATSASRGWRGGGLRLPRPDRGTSRAVGHDRRSGDSSAHRRKRAGLALTIGSQIPVRANHAPATAATLLITLDGLPANNATVGVLVIGIGIATLLCDWGRRAGGYEFHILSKGIVVGRAPKTPTDTRRPSE